MVRSLWLVERNRERIHKDVTPKKALDPDDMMTVVDDEDYPRRALSFVRQCLNDGIGAEEIALLFRLRDMAIPVEKMLRDNRIEHLPCSYGSFFERALVKAIRAWLRICAGTAAGSDYEAALGWPTRYLRRETLAALNSPGIRNALAVGADECLARIADWGDGLPDATNRDAVAKFVTTVRIGRRERSPGAILDALGFRDAAQTGTAPLGEAPPVIVYDIFRRLAEQFTSVDELEHWIRTRGDDPDYAVEEDAADAVQAVAGKVSLASVHQVKGQEFRAVAVLGPPDGMPDPRAIEQGQKEEERRTAYVAVTRAKERLLFCASRTYARELGTRKDGLTWEDYRAGRCEPAPRHAVKRRPYLRHPRSDEALVALRNWRQQKIDGTHIAPDYVLRDETLEKIARGWPTTLDALVRIDLRNSAKLRLYGPQILQVLECLDGTREPNPHPARAVADPDAERGVDGRGTPIR